MMATITSLVLYLARNMPGTLPTAIPARIPAPTLTVSSRKGGSDGNARAVITAAMAPAWSWPSAPMFNMPQRCPMATARPVKANGTLLLMLLATAWGLPSAPLSSAP